MDPQNGETLLLQKKAIEAALCNDWTQALDLNQKILETDPNNIPCLNRLAKALTETGKYSQARKLYHQVLQLDPYNSIAAKNIKRLSAFKKDGEITPSNGHIAPRVNSSLFLQEPGVTKIVNLIKLAEPQKLSLVSAGDLVQITPRARGICIMDDNNSYLGAMPDDIAHQIGKLMKGGNKYSACIKAVKQNALSVLIREVYRSRRFKNQPSFLDESHVVSFSDHIPLNSDSDVIADSDSEEGEF